MIGSWESCAPSFRLHKAVFLRETWCGGYPADQNVSLTEQKRLGFFFSLPLFSSSPPIMVEQFAGTWTLASSENFDEYMKAVGKQL